MDILQVGVLVLAGGVLLIGALSPALPGGPRVFQLHRPATAHDGPAQATPLDDGSASNENVPPVPDCSKGHDGGSGLECERESSKRDRHHDADEDDRPDGHDDAKDDD
jgi:hypothetical protein